MHYSALEKIWDKVIGGSVKILAYVALTKVELAQNVILGCHTANEAIRGLTKVKKYLDVYRKAMIIFMARFFMQHVSKFGTIDFIGIRRRHNNCSKGN